jgi:hypothetical protein
MTTGAARPLFHALALLLVVCHTYCISRRRHNLKPQMTAFEIAFVIKQNQQMIDTFTKRNAPGDAEKVQELQAANEQIKLAGLFC